MQPYLLALAGGVMIGLASALILLAHGKIAGISGILRGLLQPKAGEWDWRLAFAVGLLVGGVILRFAYPAAFPKAIETPWGLAAGAGLLVGFGTSLGNGCTSGHGVCGIGRVAPRSIVATLTFMTTGALVVFVMRHLVGG
jgi:uncharacterized membrane protein YedE/YeeE